MARVYALDFDGVLCDSCGESSASALKAAKIHWPALFAHVAPDVDEWILENMRTVRPVVETGFENILLVRLLLELRVPSLGSTTAAAVLTVEGLLRPARWQELQPRLMAEWGQDKDELVALFGSVRDKWIADDLPGWVGANRIYPGVPDALRFSSSETYIVTTKQARFAHALLESVGADVPDGRMYGLGSGPKTSVLKDLQSKHQGAGLHFVEDRLATLKNVIATPALDGWSLYLADWGYNTPEERAEAEAIPRIEVLSLQEFCGRLQ